MTAAAAVRARGLRKVFPGGVAAVDGIDLDVRPGEIFGLLGPNGAGKSTTIRMLTTLLRPTAGEVRVAGFDVVAEASRVRRRIGVALQEAGLDESATGRELLVLQGRLFGARRRAAGERAARLLGVVGLIDVAERRIGSYSGGMRRRLDLASALINNPDVVFLDEPTAGLDPASRQRIWDEVRGINRGHGVTVILTTHYLEEADRMADRVAILDHGHIVAEGTPRALKGAIGGDVVRIAVSADRVGDARAALGSPGAVTETRLDGTWLTLFLRDGAAQLAQIVRRLDDAGVPVGPVAVQNTTLDDVFLRATGYRLAQSTPEAPT
ncbi:MAG TPA: ABC transporter ATP-binding protein [Aldersonia sp.]